MTADHGGQRAAAGPQQRARHRGAPPAACVRRAGGGVSQAMLHDARHDVLFVGYQARNTPGHVIPNLGPQGGYVDLDGTDRHQAGIHTVSGYSAHADQAGLVRFVTGMRRRRPQEVRLIPQRRSRPARPCVGPSGAATGEQVRVSNGGVA